MDKHEIYAAFDKLHPPARAAPPRTTAPLPAPVNVEPPAPVEVELPDSVREAMGLPPRPDPLTRGGTDDRPG